MDMIMFQALAATTAIMIGLFASSEWKGLKGKMEGYELGKMSYVMNLLGTGISWQIFTIGVVGFIFEVSSLFSNVINALALPVVPVIAIIFFGEKMDWIKGVAMIRFELGSSGGTHEEPDSGFLVVRNPDRVPHKEPRGFELGSSGGTHEEPDSGFLVVRNPDRVPHKERRVLVLNFFFI
ncbi:hypothetical protein SLEP1_g34733 [Rubroshorea leprosula]|uniref:Uncharacterized protein n=1 Tax=Rubroshorea leprosula TaxID=152421 RepID=A0AAV5KKY3_9ROSI|nr:hypothetical protein SLEP1_g34733 [Rubroshorea leprosula]